MSTMKKTYSLGADRVVIISDDNTEISIREQGSEGKRAFFTGRRWAEFRSQMKEIDEAAQNARNDKQVSLRIHYGGGWYASVNTTVPCVDLRRWYLTRKNEVRPTKVGIALTYMQWDLLKLTASMIETEVPDMAAFTPCWHNAQQEHVECTECHPFGLHYSDM